jgi:hypothetical protein
MADDTNKQSAWNSYFYRESDNAVRSGIGRALLNLYPVPRHTPDQLLALLMQLESDERLPKRGGE